LPSLFTDGRSTPPTTLHSETCNTMNHAINTRARQGLPVSINRRRLMRRPPRSPWAIAAAAMAALGGSIIIAILATR
jgi:hypothetical protein